MQCYGSTCMEPVRFQLTRARGHAVYRGIGADMWMFVWIQTAHIAKEAGGIRNGQCGIHGLQVVRAKEPELQLLWWREGVVWLSDGDMLGTEALRMASLAGLRGWWHERRRRVFAWGKAREMHARCAGLVQGSPADSQPQIVPSRRHLSAGHRGSYGMGWRRRSRAPSVPCTRLPPAPPPGSPPGSRCRLAHRRLPYMAAPGWRETSVGIASVGIAPPDEPPA